MKFEQVDVLPVGSCVQLRGDFSGERFRVVSYRRSGHGLWYKLAGSCGREKYAYADECIAAWSDE